MGHRALRRRPKVAYVYSISQELKNDAEGVVCEITESTEGRRAGGTRAESPTNLSPTATPWDFFGFEVLAPCMGSLELVDAKKQKVEKRLRRCRM
ncbi:hypothetical protein DDZ16_06090 [Marinilabilia rubra]|uniref:Uncharacterized protein n=1 Tax=Marinilabilia rubra TaxID=2162893 RepID=A0A2U2BBQ4_9BACT|nr:hypothetical protein DDZ16_06090 [Marinilabilia rubra]